MRTNIPSGRTKLNYEQGDIKALLSLSSKELNHYGHLQFRTKYLKIYLTYISKNIAKVALLHIKEKTSHSVLINLTSQKKIITAAHIIHHLRADR